MVRPEQTVQAHLSRASELGAELRFDEPVVHWEAPAAGGPVRVQTTCATYEAEALVLTPGPWAPKVLRDLQLPLTVERRVMFWFEPKGGIEPFLVGRFPIFTPSSYGRRKTVNNSMGSRPKGTSGG